MRTVVVLAEAVTEVFAVLDLRRDPNWIRKELAWRGA